VTNLKHLMKALEISGSRVAPYILGRSQVTAQNSGAAIYGASATGSRVCRFEINTSVGAMLDLTTLVVSGEVTTSAYLLPRRTILRSQGSP